MIRFIARWWPVIVALLVTAGVSYATLPKASWASGDVLRASDLTADMQHLEAGLKGGSHTAIVNADISASAAILNSKLKVANPKAILYVSSCVGTPCTITMQSPASFYSSVTRASPGSYLATFTTPRTNATYFAVAVSNSTGANAPYHCYAHSPGVNDISIACFRKDGTTADDPNVGLVLYDDNNVSGE